MPRPNPHRAGATPRGRRAPLELFIHAAAGKPYIGFLRRHLRRAHEVLRPRATELWVNLVGDRRMGRLHQQFMNDPKTTDVLTFPHDADTRGRATSGDIVVCVDEARRQARAYGVPVEHELLLYALHGLLHLEGYDDLNEAGYRKMHRAEDRILTKLGIGATFAPPRWEARR